MARVLAPYLWLVIIFMSVTIYVSLVPLVTSSSQNNLPVVGGGVALTTNFTPNSFAIVSFCLVKPDLLKNVLRKYQLFIFSLNCLYFLVPCSSTTVRRITSCYTKLFWSRLLLTTLHYTWSCLTQFSCLFCLHDTFAVYTPPKTIQSIGSVRFIPNFKLLL